MFCSTKVQVTLPHHCLHRRRERWNNVHTDKEKKHTLFIQSRENRRTAQLVRWKSISSNEESAQKARRAGDWKLQPQNPGSDKHTKNNNYWSLESRRKKKISSKCVCLSRNICHLFFLVWESSANINTPLRTRAMLFHLDIEYLCVYVGVFACVWNYI